MSNAQTAWNLMNPWGDDELTLPEDLGYAAHPWTRIFVAEDHPEMRALLRNTLCRDGFEVVEVPDGATLMETLREEDRQPGGGPDLIISDVRMPGMSGLEVLSWIRRHDWFTPVILITGFGDRDLHLEAARLGAQCVFDKPFDIAELRAAVLRIVQPV